MRVLIVCSGNKSNGEFNFELDQPFIYEQTEKLKSRGIEFDLFLIRGKGLIGYLANTNRFRKVLKDNKYDLVHAHNGPSGFLSVFQRITPVLITFHGSDINQKKTRLLSNIASVLASHRIFVTQSLYNNLYFKPGRSYSIIPCGVNTEKFYPVEKNEARQKLGLDGKKKYVLFASAFSNPVKNYTLAFEAMKQVPGAELLELKGRTREEVNLLLSASDVLLLTSLMEGSPQVIKEAMAANCPVVTTDVGDVRNILKDSEQCFICKPDSKEIAERINRIIDAPARSNGRLKIGEYDNARIAEQVLNIYMRFGKAKMFQRCTQGIWDTSIPGIRFDEHGVSNYCRIHESLMIEFARGAKGGEKWADIVNKIASNGRGKKYDCIIGVSGGTDSSFLLHKAKLRGLRPLAVNLDNGWSSEIALKNIKKVTSALDIDLETYVIDYVEVQDVLRSHMKAGLPWIDAPTDYAIMSVLYRIARRENVKFILTGADFRSEGKQPTEWTYTDRRQIRYVHSKFGTIKLKTFPLISLVELVYLGYIRKIKTISPFNYIDYQKKGAQKLLAEKYGWEYYGGHHHENIFTRFTITYWLPEKFGIDKRLITLSAQVVSGEIARAEALSLIEKPAYNSETIQNDKMYVLKKLGLSVEEFCEIWAAPARSFKDYPSNYPIIYKFARILIPIVGKILPQKPKIFFEMEGRS